MNLAIKSVIEGGLGWNVLEEATTGALIGAISSNVQWINEISPIDQSDNIHWILYSKGGRDFSSESWTGSDFSLILRVSENSFRVAAFQAKRAANRENGFKAIQISPAAGLLRPEPQIIRMLRHSDQYRSLTTDNIFTASWVHFLIYGRTEIFHLPLTKMNEYCQKVYLFDHKVKTKEKAHEENSGGLYPKRKIEKIWKNFKTSHTYNSNNKSRFSELIACGARTPANQDAEGWMSIKGRDAAAAFIDATAPHCPALLISSKSSYKPVVSHSKSFKGASIGITIKEVMASMEALKAKLDASKSVGRSRTDKMGKS
ncbi:hypothetical protein NB689_000035 [Xanthomonas sacchari]|nr:hypothetical protein [Xanthomonas sacchari]MCW0414281.1 hypothetical protein [Xanthomonas sacchari]MCW0422066.1 hypothetical protein [Xanthomonas sacchari]MCW0435229.1 hypothetical protein [Xanthomonas sacchari]MCW0456200.1 hypothetical protein [Xanthomonas sacchari]